MRDAIVTHDASQSVTQAQDHWVYICRNAKGSVLYVGLTSCGLRRFALGHSKTAPWWADVATIDVEHLPTRKDAQSRERDLIVELEPLHNIVHLDAVTHHIPSGIAPTRWLSMTELAGWLHAEPEWVEAKMKEGMPHAFIAGDLRFKAEAVRGWLKS